MVCMVWKALKTHRSIHTISQKEEGANGFVEVGNGVTGSGGLKLATDEAQAKLEQEILDATTQVCSLRLKNASPSDFLNASKHSLSRSS